MKSPRVVDVVSVVLCALMWTPLLVAVHWWGSGLNEAGRQRALEEMPWTAGMMFCTFVVVFFILHRLLLGRILRARGVGFWLMPLAMMAVGAVCYCLLWYVGVLSFGGMAAQGVGRELFGFAYLLLVVLAGVFGTVVWVMYPMALVTQVLIRWLYRGKGSGWG